MSSSPYVNDKPLSGPKLKISWQPVGFCPVGRQLEIQPRVRFGHPTKRVVVCCHRTSTRRGATCGRLPWRCGKYWRSPGNSHTKSSATSTSSTTSPGSIRTTETSWVPHCKWLGGPPFLQSSINQRYLTFGCGPFAKTFARFSMRPFCAQKGYLTRLQLIRFS